MQRISGAGNVNNLFVSEDPQTLRPPTEITASWLNAVQEEIAGVVEGLGTPLNPSDNTQLFAALMNRFVTKDSSPHFIKNVWQIVDDMDALTALAGVPSGSEVIVMDWNGQGFGMAYWNGSAWNVQPLTVSAFDLYGTNEDNHGYYWFAGAWKIFDIESLAVPPATATDEGVVRMATWAEVLAGSLSALVVRPRFMADYIDSMFVGMIEDFSGVTPPTVWIPAAGQLILRAERPKLWQFVQSGGNTVDDSLWASNTGQYSTGDGITNFRAPDLRGEFRRGWDNGRGIDAGRVFGTGQASEIGAHQHPLRYWTNKDGAGSATRSYAVRNTGDASTGVAQDGTGFSGGSETRPRNVAFLTCIYAGTPA